MRICDLLGLSVVYRWANVPMLRQQTVADHCFRVAMIFQELCDRLSVSFTPLDWELVLHHDGPEAYSGDIPSPYKRLVAEEELRAADLECCPWYVRPESGRFTSPQLYDVFHAADMIEQYTWLRAWGTGPMAQRIQFRIRTQMEESTKVDQKVVARLCSDILDEEGRFGTRAEASR